MNERTLQQALVDHVRQVHGLLIVEFAKPGTHSRLRGVLPTGWPDWCVIVMVPITKWFSISKHIYFETKTLRGTVSMEQTLMHTLLREQGVRVEIIQSDDITEAVRQVERVLAEEGVVLRGWE